MAEGLLSRARRVVEAGVGSAVEAAERLSGSSLMRQAVRDAEHAVDDARRGQRRARRTAQQADDGAQAAAERAAVAEGEARYALSVGREDLAKAAVAQKQAAERESADALAAQAAATAQADALDVTIAELADRHTTLQHELRVHERAADASAPRQSDMPAFDDRMTRAEASFARARAASSDAEHQPGGSALGVAELRAMRDDQAIADELARLKTTMDAPPGKKARR